MPDATAREGFAGGLRKLLSLMTVLILIAAIYVGWVFYSRWSAQREFQRRQAAAAAERARADYEANGGSSLKILALYATPGVLERGRSAQLCYSVVNAKSVRFEPKIENVWPSRSRCVEVAPKRDVTYILTAQDDTGHTDTAQVKILVR